jgi:hypothetical protein
MRGSLMKNVIFAVSLILLCSACSTLSVNTDFNPEYDFSQLKTYAWLEIDKAPSADTRINNDLMVARVRNAVEKSLEARGFEKADNASADFRVNWYGAIQKKIQVETIDHFYSPYGYGALHRDPFMGGSSMRTRTAREYEVGTLIVDILDPVHHKLIWRGSGSDRLNGASNPEKATQAINEAVMAILKDFPPAEKY